MAITPDALPLHQTTPITRRIWLRETGFVLVAALIALGIIGLVSAIVWPLTIDVGANDHRFVRGFHEPEMLSGLSFRWTDGDSTLLFPPAPFGAPATLTLEVLDGHPERVGPLAVLLSINDTPITTLTLHDNLRRQFSILAPPSFSLRRTMEVRLQSDAPLVPADGRHLGLVVFKATLAPTSDALPLPSFWLALWAAIFGGALYGAVRLIGGQHRSALLATGIGVTLVAISMLLRPMEILPFLPRFGGMTTIAGFGIAMIRALTPPASILSNRAFPAVNGTYAAISMGIGYWMPVLYQHFMVWDGATGIGPSPWTTGVGGALAAGLGIGLPLWWIGWGRRLPLDTARQRAAQIALGLLASAAAVHLGFSLWYAFTRQAPDFWIIFRGVREWVRGGSLYDLEAVRTNHFGHVFKVPPFYGMLFVPLVRAFDGLSVLLAHRVMNVLLLVATAALWLRMWRIPLWSAEAAALLIVLNFRPLADTIAFGQIDLVLLLLLTGALWALRTGRDGAAGVLVAVGALFKIYPVLLLVFFVLKRRWRGLWGFALGMLVCNGMAIAVMGWEMHRVYLFEVLPKIGGTTSWVENQTISGFIARLAASPQSATIFADQSLQLLGTVISALAALAIITLSIPPVGRRSPAFALQYGLYLLLMVLCVPAAWMHYQTLLVIPFASLLLELRERPVPLPYAAALGLSFGLIAYGNQWSFYSGIVTGVLTILGVSYKLYGMLLLGALAAVALLRPVKT